MSEFQEIDSSDSIKEIIKSAFDMEVALEGGWGYSQADATEIYSTNHLPMEQFEHTLATMRAYIEMNMTQEESQRYGSINPKEIDREDIVIEEQSYQKVTYAVSGMREDQYADFINEYKNNYGKADFDMGEHFERRKEATLTRNVEHWFLNKTV